jgi:hypothetical protein
MAVIGGIGAGIGVAKVVDPLGERVFESFLDFLNL